MSAPITLVSDGGWAVFCFCLLLIALFMPGGNSGALREIAESIRELAKAIRDTKEGGRK